MGRVRLERKRGRHQLAHDSAFHNLLVRLRLGTPVVHTSKHQTAPGEGQSRASKRYCVKGLRP